MSDGQTLDALKDSALAQVAAAGDLAALDAARVNLLGKSGSISAEMAKLGKLPPDERKAFGQAVNVVKQTVESALKDRLDVLKREALAARLVAEKIDITQPVPRPAAGKLHPITQTIDELIAIFGQMGFTLAEGPDIEDDFHNFTALNFPIGHPARESHDTFYLPDAPEAGKDGSHKMLLRTHTSPVQIRTMLSGKPPIRVIVPGRTYRSDSDQTHTPMFHQIEALVIDRNIHMGHLRGTITEFVRAFFEQDDIPVRFRSSFFPFTEPSAEVDIGCSRKGGEIKIGKFGDWLEILGSGMVHPNVIRACGLDPDEWQGFAFGMGIERIAMLKYGIPDLRTFFDADLRWLDHYGFPPLDIPSLITGLGR
jgi:phenylalanyl-tRNA synthetase alpha chain